MIKYYVEHRRGSSAEYIGIRFKYSKNVIPNDDGFSSLGAAENWLNTCKKYCGNSDKFNIVSVAFPDKPEKIGEPKYGQLFSFLDNKNKNHFIRCVSTPTDNGKNYIFCDIDTDVMLKPWTLHNYLFMQERGKIKPIREHKIVECDDTTFVDVSEFKTITTASDNSVEINYENELAECKRLRELSDDVQNRISELTGICVTDWAWEFEAVLDLIKSRGGISKTDELYVKRLQLIRQHSRIAPLLGCG